MASVTLPSDHAAFTRNCGWSSSHDATIASQASERNVTSRRNDGMRTNVPRARTADARTCISASDVMPRRRVTQSICSVRCEKITSMAIVKGEKGGKRGNKLGIGRTLQFRSLPWRHKEWLEHLQSVSTAAQVRLMRRGDVAKTQTPAMKLNTSQEY